VSDNPRLERKIRSGGEARVALQRERCLCKEVAAATAVLLSLSLRRDAVAAVLLLSLSLRLRRHAVFHHGTEDPFA
jgi:hypothetical protein